MIFFFFKQKTAYEMRISDWSSDVCSSDLTHPDITRFFMTVKEAVQLILQSSADALANDAQRGNIYVLDMGKPVRILDMARQMIMLSGLEPEVEIGRTSCRERVCQYV